MKHGRYQEKALLRQAFDLLLELRSQPEVLGLPGEVVTHRRLLARQGESAGLPSSFPSERCVLRVSRLASQLPAARADWSVAHYFLQRSPALAARSVCLALWLLRRLRNRGTRGFRRARRDAGSQLGHLTLQLRCQVL